jgi:hypothetical protein
MCIFKPRSLCLRGKKPSNRLDKRLGGPNISFERFGEDKNLLPLLQSNRRSPISLCICCPDFAPPALLYLFIYFYQLYRAPYLFIYVFIYLFIFLRIAYRIFNT